MTRLGKATVLWALLLAGLPLRSAIGQQVVYSGGLSYSDGRYIFEDPIRTVSSAHSISVSHKRMAFVLTIPIVYQDAPWISYTYAAAIPSGGSQHGAVGNRGRGPGGRHNAVPLDETDTFDKVAIADPTMRLEYGLYESLFGNEVVLTGATKVPVASLESGFGTGAWDAGIGISSTFRVRAQYVFADVAYWSFGDMPDLELRSALSYAFAVGQPFSADRYGLIVSIAGLTRVIDHVTPPASVSLGLARFGRKRDFSLKAGLGLTESSPDFSFSLGWSLPLMK